MTVGNVFIGHGGEPISIGDGDPTARAVTAGDITNAVLIGHGAPCSVCGEPAIAKLVPVKHLSSDTGTAIEPIGEGTFYCRECGLAVGDVMLTTAIEHEDEQ